MASDQSHQSEELLHVRYELQSQKSKFREAKLLDGFVSKARGPGG